MKKLDLNDYSMLDDVNMLNNYVSGLLNGDEAIPCIQHHINALQEKINKHVGKIMLMNPEEYQFILDKLGLTHLEVVENKLPWKELTAHLDIDKLNQEYESSRRS